MSRKIHTSLFPLALILGLGSGAWQPASAATRNVGASEAYTTIAAAIAAAGDGDVINIVDSTITECGIYINKSVTIQGPWPTLPGR